MEQTMLLLFLIPLIALHIIVWVVLIYIMAHDSWDFGKRHCRSIFKRRAQ